jgi:predicted GIY-YIG superfamily endonuclease
MAMHGIEKRTVYIIRSEADPSRHYVGLTNDLRARLEWHNHGPCGHTVSHRPWSVAVSLEFPAEKQAVRFEMSEVWIRARVRDQAFRRILTGLMVRISYPPSPPSRAIT